MSINELEIARRLHEVFVNELREIGVAVIDVSDETADPLGRLLERYSVSEDTVHANADWGGKVLRRVLLAEGENSEIALN